MATKTRKAQQPWVNRDACRRRRRYISQGDCNRAVKGIRRSKGGSFDDQKSYWCDVCDGWHLARRVAEEPTALESLE